MAGKRTEMSKIKQILLLHKDGMSNRKIGERLGLYKETVNKYVNAAKSDSKSIEELVKMDEPELQRRFSAGNAAYSDKRFDALQEDLEYYVRELERRHVTMYLLWEEYRQKHPDGYGYTQFCYHLNQHKASADPEVSLPMSNFREGGNELFIDFAGDTMSYVDLDTGEEVKCQIFVACLPASDYGYAMAVPSQKVEDFLHALSSCLRHIGGVPRILVTDNLKSSVARPDRYMPELNVIMEDFANHYGCVTIPARSGHPKDKALVEDQVQIVYRRVYAPLRNEMFHSIRELNTAIAEKMKQHNQKRMQRLPFTREERFLSLAACEYIKQGASVLVTGPAGVGKSFIASALGHQACFAGYKVRYANMQKLLEDMHMARIESKAARFFDKMAALDLLIIDDFGMRVLDGRQLLDFMELIEDRHGRKSTIIASQLPVKNWYDILAKNPTIADAILDRVVKSAYRIDLNGVSMRK